jgi:hypothetical protein
MTKKQAHALKEGRKVAAIHTVPSGVEGGKTLFAATVLTFKRIIPKVCIVNREVWQDGHDEMLFCRTSDGKRAWLNISNALIW